MFNFLGNGNKKFLFFRKMFNFFKRSREKCLIFRRNVQFLPEKDSFFEEKFTFLHKMFNFSAKYTIFHPFLRSKVAK